MRASAAAANCSLRRRISSAVFAARGSTLCPPFGCLPHTARPPLAAGYLVKAISIGLIVSARATSKALHQQLHIDLAAIAFPSAKYHRWFAYNTATYVDRSPAVGKSVHACHLLVSIAAYLYVAAACYYE